MAGGDQENKMENEPMVTGEKLAGGLPGAMEQSTITCIATIKSPYLIDL